MERPNLTDVTGATVKSQRLRNTYMGGVNFVAAGEMHHADAQETVLAAGAIGSPQIMQLSGIGPADLLNDVGVPVKHDLPGVGENLQDHFHYRARWEIDQPLTFYGRTSEQTAEVERLYAEESKGPLTTNHFESGAFLRSGPNVDIPDSERRRRPCFISKGAPEYRPPDRHGFTISGFPTRPWSRGRVSIASSDPLDRPIIDPGYLSDPADINLMGTIIKEARKIVSQEAFSRLNPVEITPGVNVQSEEDLLRDIREISSTSFHPVGSCRMGQGDDCVVAPDLKVRGLEGLSVADASVMPQMNTGHPNAPVIMIAEKAADLIAQRA